MSFSIWGNRSDSLFQSSLAGSHRQSKIWVASEMHHKPPGILHLLDLAGLQQNGASLLSHLAFWEHLAVHGTVRVLINWSTCMQEPRQNSMKPLNYFATSSVCNVNLLCLGACATVARKMSPSAATSAILESLARRAPACLSNRCRPLSIQTFLYYRLGWFAIDLGLLRAMYMRVV